MTRSHRFAHRLIWPALAVAVVLGLTMALALRPPPDRLPQREPSDEHRLPRGAVEPRQGRSMMRSSSRRSRCSSSASSSIARQLHPPKNLADAIDIWIRATGSCAFLMLTVILCIGPLARLNRDSCRCSTTAAISAC